MKRRRAAAAAASAHEAHEAHEARPIIASKRVRPLAQGLRTVSADADAQPGGPAYVEPLRNQPSDDAEVSKPASMRFDERARRNWVGVTEVCALNARLKWL